MAGVSIIIPCHNVLTNVGQTLSSVRAQTFTDWQAVLVNDGSTDETTGVLHAWVAAEPRAQLVEQPNRGLPAARNAGLNRAAAPFVLFLDAGDLLEPFALALLNEALDENSQAGAACGGWEFIGPGGERGEWFGGPPRNRLAFSDFAVVNPVNTDSLLVRREWLERAGGFDASLPHCTCEDWDLWARMARCGCLFMAVSQSTSRYRMTPGSGSRRVACMLEAGLIVIRRTHGPDNRCRTPDPSFIAGAPETFLPRALANWSGFCMACAFAAGGPLAAEEIFNQAGPPARRLDPAALARHLYFAVPYTRCVFPARWPELWDELSSCLQDWLGALERSLASADFASRCLSHLCQLTANGRIADRLSAVVQERGPGLRRVVVYGTGRNGQELLRRLHTAGIATEVADDAEGNGGISPFLSDLDDQLVVVTPWDNAAMCERLTAAGARRHRHFIAWTDVDVRKCTT